MHFQEIIGNLGSNHIWRYFWFLNWPKLHLQALATLLNCFLLVCKLYKSGISFIHYIFKMSRYTNIVYIGRYLALTYIERFISTVCCFFSYICWSVNSTIFFWHTRKLRQDLYLRVLILSFMKSSFLTLRYFFAFFIWSVNCSRDFFSHFVSQ